MSCTSLQHLRPGKLAACVVILPSYRVCNCVAYSSPVECRPPCLTSARALYELYSYYVISRTDVLQNAAIHPMNGTQAPFFSTYSEVCIFFLEMDSFTRMQRSSTWEWLGQNPGIPGSGATHLSTSLPCSGRICVDMMTSCQLRIYCLVQPRSSIPSHISPLPEPLLPE